MNMASRYANEVQYCVYNGLRNYSPPALFNFSTFQHPSGTSLNGNGLYVINLHKITHNIKIEGKIYTVG